MAEERKVKNLDADYIQKALVGEGVSATTDDIEKIRKALVSAGILQAARLSQADHAKVAEELSKISPVPNILCANGNYVLVVRKT